MGQEHDIKNSSSKHSINSHTFCIYTVRMIEDLYLQWYAACTGDIKDKNNN